MSGEKRTRDVYEGDMVEKIDKQLAKRKKYKKNIKTEKVGGIDAWTQNFKANKRANKYVNYAYGSKELPPDKRLKDFADLDVAFGNDIRRLERMAHGVKSKGEAKIRLQKEAKKMILYSQLLRDEPEQERRERILNYNPKTLHRLVDKEAIATNKAHKKMEKLAKAFQSGTMKQGKKPKKSKNIIKIKERKKE